MNSQTNTPETANDIQKISQDVFLKLSEMFKLQHDNMVKQGGGISYLNNPSIDLEAAIMSEAGEALESGGYVWWKDKPIDVHNYQVELIDIWHFFLTSFIIGGVRPYTSPDATEAQIKKLVGEMSMAWANSHYNYFIPMTYGSVDMDKVTEHDKKLNFKHSRETLKAFVKRLLIKEDPRIIISAFVECMMVAGMSFDKFYQMFVCKNALNTLRDKYGYKKGEYNKQWDGKEDNAYVKELFDKRDSVPNSFEAVFAIIESEYIRLFNIDTKAPKIQLL